MRHLTEREATLLTRTQFREQALARDGHRCVVCGRTDRPLDVHHILERRLFEAGGYFLENAATLCDERTEGCHTRAEQTLITPEELRERCGIGVVVLPENLYPDAVYTKWADTVHPDGTRSPGPLFWDESVQRILAEGGVLGRYDHHTRYGRTWHLPCSEHATSDDRQLGSAAHLVGEEVVVTLKLDGQNLSLYHDGLHGRSLRGASHPSQSVARSVQPGLMLDPDMRLVVENLQARHTVRYLGLEHPLYVINLWRRGECLSWDETELYAAVLGLPVVPVLWRGVLQSPGQLQTLFEQAKAARHEGIVVRLAGAFGVQDFPRSVAKAVSGPFGRLRDTTHHDWKRQRLVPNLVGPGPLRVIWPGEAGYDGDLKQAHTEEAGAVA